MSIYAFRSAIGFLTGTLFFLCSVVHAQGVTDNVNVFLGSSGDHGQLSPGASSPFHQMNIAPLTNPRTHTGYEYLAKEILGFTHNRFEGVGCMGSGGLLLVRPFLGANNENIPLHKVREHAGPGYYELETKEGISAHIAVKNDFGKERYQFPKGPKGLFIDLAHAFNGAFVNNEFIRKGNKIIGKVSAKTTCNVGVYTVYYAVEVPDATHWQLEGNQIEVYFPEELELVEMNIAFSAVSTGHAEERLVENSAMNYQGLKQEAIEEWESKLNILHINGDETRKGLFYSLLYRVLQSPYQISEADGSRRGTDGQLYQSTNHRYHGWAIWDNYKTQLPLIELLYPTIYQNIVFSVSDLYRYGKYDFAGPYEPANSVRTEHAAVVLLDAQRKGYTMELEDIRDSLIRDTIRFDFTKPDKYLEAAYDMWAMAGLLTDQADLFKNRARSYRKVWQREFADLSGSDVDRMSARNMYQGTVRQYRWNVPFDANGLVALAGGKNMFTGQLDDFYDNYYFNRANEPDMQSLTLYYASEKPWRYQEWTHRLALDTVIQYYFNNDSRGIEAHIDRIYKNEPKAFIRTMDDDAGAMSGWWVLSALGLHQPLVGEPIYYLSVPFFEEIFLKRENMQPLQIRVVNFADPNRYVRSVRINGKDLGRLWLTREEIRRADIIEIEATDEPTTYGVDNIWTSELR